MDALALVTWSMALGVIAALAAARLADLVARPTLSRLRAVGYHASVFLLVLVLSGVLAQAHAPSRVCCWRCRCWRGRCASGFPTSGSTAGCAPASATS